MRNNTSRLLAIVSYITWIGWFVAFFLHDRSDEYAVVHLNQSIVLNILEVIAGAVTILPLLGDQISNIVRLAVFVLWCMGIYRAATWRTDPLPIVGEINLVR